MTERGNTMAAMFAEMTIKELEGLLQTADTREDKALFRALLNLKIQLKQEEIIGEVLV
ncbi:MAG: hypothetical protein IJW46_04440 [Clostridia bacterium]|nr:hypothetical protein [Clostridia bacterium]